MNSSSCPFSVHLGIVSCSKVSTLELRNCKAQADGLELASKADTTGPVVDALAAAQRLVQVCNENQTYDLEALRRPVSTGGKKRPKSTGPWFVEST